MAGATIYCAGAGADRRQEAVAIPELYAITRPSATVGVGWPAILRVSREKPLVVEDWTLRITETNGEAPIAAVRVYRPPLK